MADDVKDEWVIEAFRVLEHTPHNWDKVRAAISAVAPLIRTAERDACVTIAWNVSCGYDHDTTPHDVAEEIRTKIQARGATHGR